jgi:hypothetical protein
MNAVGEYCGSFNAENMAFNTKTGADEAAQMRWVMLEQYRRIIMSNEIKSVT